jgi:hypothetical protein
MNIHHNGLIVRHIQAGFGKQLAAFLVLANLRPGVKSIQEKGQWFDGNERS